MDSRCFLCSVAQEMSPYDAELVIGRWDNFPVSSGHALVVPRRHVVSWFEATNDERHAMMLGIDAMRSLALSLSQNSIEGWTIGINDGPAAGQTVPHLHVHLIPRRRGDVEDPRGGVRWVIPQHANYWSS